MRRLDTEDEGDGVHPARQQTRAGQYTGDAAAIKGRYSRVRLAGAIGTNDGGKIRIAKQEGMVALVGLEV
jgi:hypothetical protein